MVTMSDAKVRPVAKSSPTSGHLDSGLLACVSGSPPSPASSGSSGSPTHPPVSSSKPHSSSFSIDALVGNLSGSEKPRKPATQPEEAGDLWHSQESELRRIQELYYQRLYGESLAAGLKLNSYLTYPTPVSSLNDLAAMPSRGPTEHNHLLSYYYNILMQQKSNLYADQYLKALSSFTNHRTNGQFEANAERNSILEKHDIDDIRPDSPFNLSQRGSDSANACEELSSQIESDQSVPRPPSRDPSPPRLSSQVRSSQPSLPLSLLSVFDKPPAELSSTLPSSGYPALLGTASESPSSAVAMSRSSPGLYSSFCDYDLLKGKNLLVGAENSLSSPGTPGSQGTLHSPLNGSNVPGGDLGPPGTSGNSAAAVAAAYHLSSMFRKPKRIRTAFSPGQLLRLEEIFEKNRYVVGCERKQLARDLNLSETQIKVWFQNRRTKHKREKHIGTGQQQSRSHPGHLSTSSSGHHYTPSVSHATSTSSSSSLPYLSSSNFSSLAQASVNAYFKSPTNSPRTLVAGN